MSYRIIRVLTVAVALTWGAVAQAPASARQVTRAGGSIQGTVKDDSGGIIRNATITLDDQGGPVKTTKTGSDGSYVFHGVAAGVYSVSATYAGLQQATALAASVTGSQAATANIVMTVKAQREEVTVSATNDNTV